VETVLVHGKANNEYHNILDAWARPDCLVAIEEFKIDILDTNTWLDRAKQVKRHVDHGEPGILVSECDGWNFILDNHKNSTDFYYLVECIGTFIKEGFNRESEKADGIYRITPSIDPPWLFAGVTAFSLAEFCKLKIEEWDKYKRLEIGNKEYDLNDIMKDKNHRLHRAIVKTYKKYCHVLKHNKKLREHAAQWYKCRVDPGNIEIYLNKLSEKEEQNPDKPKDRSRIQADLVPFDEAFGYLHKL